MHELSSVSTGSPLIVTFELPGAHGAAVTGTHGICVSTPWAAAVADATWGLAMDLHVPNGKMFVIGIMSATVAVGWDSPSVRFVGNTVSELVALPWLHLSVAPLTTILGMSPRIPTPNGLSSEVRSASPIQHSPGYHAARSDFALGPAHF